MFQKPFLERWCIKQNEYTVISHFQSLRDVWNSRKSELFLKKRSTVLINVDAMISAFGAKAPYSNSDLEICVHCYLPCNILLRHKFGYFWRQYVYFNSVKYFSTYRFWSINMLFFYSILSVADAEFFWVEI